MFSDRWMKNLTGQPACRVREISCVIERAEAPGQLGARTPCIDREIQEASGTTLAGMDRSANAKVFLGRDSRSGGPPRDGELRRP